MHINHRIKLFSAAILGLLLSWACEPDSLPVAFAPEREDAAAWADLPLSIHPEDEGEGTKASLLRDVESKGSGALVLVFRSTSRQLESYRFFTQDELRNQTAVPLKLRVPLEICDFYILGNLNGIRKSDGTVGNLMDALGAAFPIDEGSLESWVYRLDGGDLNALWRRQRFDEVASCGIPYLHIARSVNVAAQIRSGGGIPGSEACRRLFSKVTLRIDHAAFDGGGANPEFFVNSKLYLRQANARLQPFSETPQRAAEAADVLVQSDYDPQMGSTNASVTTFSFYVPENMQGTLLPGNTDSRSKTRDALVAAGKSAVVPYLTYVEFSGHLDTAAGGYGGDATYRFYIGEDNCSNFDLGRGREYTISLTFRIGSLFEPDWKVTLDNWNDRRLFCLTADPSFADKLPEGKRVAVRANRDGAFYLYMNPSGRLGGTNALAGRAAAASPAFIPASLSDCSWYGALMQAGTDDARWLSERGITPGWDATTCRLRLRVTDPSRFAAHLGESRSFSVSLLPGGGQSRFEVCLYPDIDVTVAGGLSLTENFYLGQTRSVTVTGLSGGTVKYAAVQKKVGASGSSALNSNVQWKTAAIVSLDYPGCALDARGNVLLDVSNNAYANQTYTGSLSVCAFYPNRFQSSHAGWTSGDGSIIFFSEDYVNDSFEVPVRILEPRLKTATGGGEIVLPIDGTEQPIPDFGYQTFDGSADLDRSDFDSALYNELLAFRHATSGNFSECVKVDPDADRIYCHKTVSSLGKLEDLDCNDAGALRYNGSKIYVSARVATNPSTGLFNGDVFQKLVSLSKLVVTGFRLNNTGSYDTGNEIVYRITDYFYKSGVNPYTTDGKFSFNVRYRFNGSDLSSLSVDRTGPANTYTTLSGETFGPVLDLVNATYDTGNGGAFDWVYDESHQTMTARSGEPVPGGILLPYGEQRVSFSYRNKWDGRIISGQSGKSLKISYELAFGVVVGATARRNAMVHILPTKNVKYLVRCAPQASKANRTAMTYLFGHRGWYDIRVAEAYPYYSRGYRYYKPLSSYALPLKDYDVRYLKGFGSADKWSQAAVNALDAVFEGSSSPKDMLLTLVEPYSNRTFGEWTTPVNFGYVDAHGTFTVNFITGGTYNQPPKSAVFGIFVNKNEDFSD